MQPTALACRQAAPHAVELTVVEHRLALGAGWVDTGLVFTRPTGEALMGYTVQRSFEFAVRKAAVPRIRFHDLRHTHATLALANGVPAKVVQERLGHHSAAFTRDVYGLATPGMRAELPRRSTSSSTERADKTLTSALSEPNDTVARRPLTCRNTGRAAGI